MRTGSAVFVILLSILACGEPGGSPPARPAAEEPDPGRTSRTIGAAGSELEEVESGVRPVDPEFLRHPGPGFLAAIEATVAAAESTADLAAAEEEVRAALLGLGERALPVLLEGLDSGSHRLRRVCALALAELGPAARAAVPRLLELAEVSIWPTIDVCWLALARIAPDAPGVPRGLLEGAAAGSAVHAAALRGLPAAVAPRLLPFLADSAPTIRRAAARCLLDFSPEVLEPCTPALAAMLEAEDTETRREAAQVLAKFAPDHPDLAEVALDALTADEDRAWWAIAVLGKQGERVLPALVSALVEACRDTNRFGVAMHLAEALSHLHPPAEVVVPILTEIFENAPDDLLRFEAARQLTRHGAAGVIALPWLTARFEDASRRHDCRRGPSGVSEAAAIASLGPLAEAAIPALVEGARGLNALEPATRTLALLGPKGLAALEVLAAEEEGFCVFAASLELARARPGDQRAADRLADALAGIGSASGICHALRCMGADDEALAPAVEPLLASPEADLRLAVASALLRMCPGHAPARVALRDLLAAAESGVRSGAAWLLARDGLAVEAAVAVFRECLRDPEAAHHDALQMLGELGPRARDAVPEIAALVMAEEVRIRIAALEVLAAIGPAAGEALPVVEAATFRPPLDVARAARDCAARIRGE
jgi:hypothetical protein